MRRRLSTLTVLAILILLVGVMVPVGAVAGETETENGNGNHKKIDPDATPFDDLIDHCKPYVSFYGDGSEIPAHDGLWGETAFFGGVVRNAWLGWIALMLSETTKVWFEDGTMYAEWYLRSPDRHRRINTNGNDDNPPNGIRYDSDDYTGWLKASGDVVWDDGHFWAILEVTDKWSTRFAYRNGAVGSFGYTKDPVKTFLGEIPVGTLIYVQGWTYTNGPKLVAQWLGCIDIIMTPHSIKQFWGNGYVRPAFPVRPT